jgi:hypothetical protein
MRRIVAAAVILSAVGLWATPKPKPEDLRTGEVIAVETTRDVVGPHDCQGCGALTRVLASRTTVRATTAFTIKGPDYVYFVFDYHSPPCRLAQGDHVTYLPYKGKLQVVDLDGKECKLDIVKQQRTDTIPR